MDIETKLSKMRLKAARDYDALPDFLKKTFDANSPEVDSFSSEQEELEYLRGRLSRLASLWLGIYSGAVIFVTMIVGLGVKLLQLVAGMLQ